MYLIFEFKIIIKIKIVKFGFFEVFFRSGSNVYLKYVILCNYWKLIVKMGEK